MSNGIYQRAWARVGRVRDIADRYLQNIRDSKKYQNAFERNPDGTRNPIRGFAKAVNTQMSRRQYMGLSNG